MGTGSENRHVEAVAVADVFLCHNSKDKDEVDKIREYLGHREIKAWMDKYDFEPFEPWVKQLESVISQTKSAAVFIGQSGFGPWQRKELELFRKEFTQRGIRMGLVILPTCPDEFLQVEEVSEIAREFHYVDLRQPNPDPIEKLIQGISGKSNNIPDAVEADVKEEDIKLEALDQFKVLKNNTKLRISIYEDGIKKMGIEREQIDQRMINLSNEIETANSRLEKINRRINQIEKILIENITAKDIELTDYLSEEAHSLASTYGNLALQNSCEILVKISRDEVTKDLFYWTIRELINNIRLSIIEPEFYFPDQIEKLYIPLDFKNIYIESLLHVKKKLVLRPSFQSLTHKIEEKFSSLILSISNIQF